MDTYKCDKCDYVAMDDNTLLTHKETAHPDLKCEICEKGFTRIDNLIRHKKTHEQNHVTFECDVCEKTFSLKHHLVRHQKIHDKQEFECDVCQKKFSRNDNLLRHKKTHDRQPAAPKYQCEVCDFTTGRKDDLQRHLKTHEERKRKAESLFPQPSKKKRDPNHKRRETPNDLADPLEPPSELDIREEHREIYNNNWIQIRTKFHEGKHQYLYNFRLTDTSADSLAAIFNQAHGFMRYQYKVNFSFGFVLYNNLTGERRYYHASNNTRVLEAPRLIQSAADLPGLLDYLENDLDMLEYARKQRPNSQWIVDGITNVLLYIYPIRQSPIGCGLVLPDFIKNNPAIISLERDHNTNQPYDDNLCLFRCIALFKGANVKSLANPTKMAFTKYATTKGITESSFKGVNVYELYEIEDMFGCNINVYTINEEGQAQLVRRSINEYHDTMYLNLHEEHFSYIPEFDSYAKSFKCRSCETVFQTKWQCQRHEKNCKGGVRITFPGGVYKPGRSIFELLEDCGIQVPAENERFFPFRATFDIECVLKKETDLNDTTKLSWLSEHEIASVSVTSNIPEFDKPICFVSDGDSKALAEKFIDYLEQCSERSYKLLCDRYAPTIQSIDELLKEQYEELGEDAECGPPLANLKGRFHGYLHQLPVVGFNSGRYDVNAMKKVFFPTLNQVEKIGITVKKQNNYMCISTDNFKFLDISNYLAAGTSYAQFLKAFKIKESKGFFPYEWLTDIKKLQERELPPINAFYSTLKAQTIEASDYQYCKDVWEKENMQSMQDFLIWYNNLDVEPFMAAIEKMCLYFQSCHLDVFKDAISMPGLAMKDLFNDINTFFSLPKNGDLFYLIRNQIVGGPSIIFNRHQEAGKTKIRQNKTCGGIVGFDANALYLWSLMQPMPTGYYITRDAEDDFSAKHSHRYGQMANEWLTWKSGEENIEIIREHTHGREIRIGARSIPVDGCNNRSRKIWQFHGCLFHGHDCWCTRVNGQPLETNPLNGKEMKKLANETRDITDYLKSQGYEVEEIYECQWRNQKKNNPKVRQFIQQNFSSWSQLHRGKLTQRQIIDNVIAENIFGMVLCDIKVPDNIKHHFAEMPPIFKNAEVSIDDIGDTMKAYAMSHDLLSRPRRMLIGSMCGDKILLTTPLLKWYLHHGLEVTKIYKVIEYEPNTCFKAAGERVSNARRAGDADPDKSIIAEMEKLKGNSYYGKTATNKEKHVTVQYLQQSEMLEKVVSHGNFRSLSELAQDFYEIESQPSAIKNDLPIQIAFFVYNYAKLRMLEFYYDFMLMFFDKSDFEYCEMDTDSAYIAFSNRDWLSLMKPEKRDEYFRARQNCHLLDCYKPDNKYNWFPRECCKEHANFDKRTPGLFKVEWEGDGIVSLCSKTYYCFGGQKDKFSSKGIQKRGNDLNKDMYLNVLYSQESAGGTNRGFRSINNKIYTYEQFRNGLSYFYPKRKVNADGISTEPLDI